MIPATQDNPDQKMIGTLALEFSSQALMIMAKYLGVSKRAAIDFLETEDTRLQVSTMSITAQGRLLLRICVHDFMR